MVKTINKNMVGGGEAAPPGKRGYSKITANDVDVVKNLASNGFRKPGSIMAQMALNGKSLGYKTTKRILSGIADGLGSEEIAAAKSGRGRKYKTPGITAELLTEKIKKIYVANPDNNGKSQRDLAKRLKVSQAQVCKGVKKANLKPFKKVACQMTSKSTAARRVEMCKYIINWLDGQGEGAWDRLFFTDESTFYPTLRATGGQQNSRVYHDVEMKKRDLPNDELLKPKPTKEQGVMIFVAMSAAGHIAAPHFIPKGQTVTAEYYMNNMCDNDIFVQIEALVADGPIEKQKGSCKSA